MERQTVNPLNFQAETNKHPEPWWTIQFFSTRFESASRGYLYTTYFTQSIKRTLTLCTELVHSCQKWH